MAYTEQQLSNYSNTANNRISQDYAMIERLEAQQAEKRKTDPTYSDSTIQSLRDRIGKQYAKKEKFDAIRSGETPTVAEANKQMSIQRIRQEAQDRANAPENRRERYQETTTAQQVNKGTVVNMDIRGDIAREQSRIKSGAFSQYNRPERTPDGMITEDKSGGFFNLFGSGYKQGFFLSKDVGPSLQYEKFGVKQAGQFSGVMSNIILGGKGPEILGGASKAKDVILKGSKFKTFIFGTGEAIVTTEGSRRYAENVLKGQTLTQEQKSITKTKQFKTAFGDAVTTTQDKQGLVKSIATGINIGFSDKNLFAASLEAEFKKQGYKGEELKKAVELGLKQRKTLATSEAVSMISLERASESVGRRLFQIESKRQFEKAAAYTSKNVATKTGWTAFKSIAPAGFIEGSVGVAAQSRGRNQKVNPKEVAIGGAFGYGFSGALGSSIVGTGVNKPGASKVLKSAAYITDPLEYPGDLLEDAVRSTRKAGPKVFTPTPEFTLANVPTTNKGKGYGFVPSSSVSSQDQSTKIDLKAMGLMPTNTKTTVKTNAPTFTNPLNMESGRGNNAPNIIGSPSNTPADTPADTPTDINNVIDNVNDNVNNQVNTPTDSPTNINNIIGFTPVNTPIVTPIFKAPPPVLPMFSFGGGGASRGGNARRSKKYVNELAASRNLLQSLGSGVPTSLLPRVLTKKKPVTSPRKSGKKKYASNKRGRSSVPIYREKIMPFKLPFDIL